MIELIIIVIIFIFTAYLYKENKEYKEEVRLFKIEVHKLNMINKILIDENEKLKERLYGEKMELYND